VHTIKQTSTKNFLVLFYLWTTNSHSRRKIREQTNNKPAHLADKNANEKEVKCAPPPPPARLCAKAASGGAG